MRAVMVFLIVFSVFALQPIYAQPVPTDGDILSSLKITEEDKKWILAATSGQYEHSDIPRIHRAFSAFLHSLKELTNSKLIFLSEREREDYSSYITSVLWKIQRFSILESNKFPPLAGIAYDCVLFNKGFLLDMSHHIEFAKRNLKKPQTKELWGYIDDMKSLLDFQRGFFYSQDFKEDYKEIKDMTLRNKDSIILALLDEYDKELSYLEEVEKYIAENEKELILSMKGTLSELDQPDWKIIRDLLKADEACIEYVICPKEAGDTSRICNYYALLLRQNDPYPQVVRLDVEDNLSKPKKQLFIQNSKTDSAYSMVWKYIEKHLKDIKNIYLSSTGMLSSISYAQMKNNKGEYTTDQYTIHSVTSTKDISKRKKDEEVAPFKNVVLFGGADYGLPGQPATSRAQGVGYLPESKQEVLEISYIISKDGWAKPFCYHGDKSTKDRFITTVQELQPHIIHISTHGFYFLENESSYNNSMSTEYNLIRTSGLSLMRFGLLFSGANHLWEGNEPLENIDDGVLTAQEISRLNLSATRLVVLSGCNTGIGGVDYNEGIYGLQRAFRLAGVNSIIASQRKVPDKETKELMVAFYNHLVTGMGTKEAFDNAQKVMRRNYPDNPEKWAYFILIE